MNSYDPNVNSKTINPLTITKPQYKDSSIEDIYLEEGEISNVLRQNSERLHNVVIIKRISPDMVKKFTYEFKSKNEAKNFINTKPLLDCVQDVLSVVNDIGGNDIANSNRPCLSKEIQVTNKKISFAYDNDTDFENEVNKINNQPMLDNESNSFSSELKKSANKKKWDI